MRWSLLGLLLSGCSLMGLDDFELEECASDADCARVGTQTGDHAQCRRFFCAADRVCRAHPTEACDGLDNDCDGVIDENAPHPSPTVRVTGVAASGVDYASGFDGRTTAAWTTEDGMAHRALVPLENDAPGARLRHAMLEQEAVEPDGAYDPRDVALTEGCPVRAMDGTVDRGTCTFADLALESFDDTSILAAVSTQGCPAGQLRIGHVARDATQAEMVLLGPRRRSSTYLGIGPCDTTSTGAARPAIAALDDPAATIPGALVAWLAAPVSRGECGGVAADVVVLVAHLRASDRLAAPFQWVDGSGEGMPQVIGTTIGGGPPAVTALEDRGYLVAHGDATGAIRIHFVPRGPSPPEWDGVSGSDPEDRTGLETASLAGITEVVVLDATNADHVAIAPGAIRDDEVDLAVTWRSGCGSDARAIQARIVTLALGTAVSASTTSERVAIATGASLGAPAIAWSPAGFLVPGTTRGGGEVTDDSAGGWVVAWADGMRLDAARISELDRALLSPDEPIVLMESSGDEEHAPELHRDAAGRFRFFHVDRTDTIVEGPALCAE